MSVALFDGFLSSPEMIAVFDDGAMVQAMFDFEAALARAQAAHGVIPDSAARAIAGVCKAPLYDIPALVRAGRRAGSLAIPLVKELTAAVALYDEEASTFVHRGSTSQDVIDSAMVLVTREALALVERDLARLVDALLALAERHLDTPVLARTLMQPAQVSSFGLKAAQWAAPLVRARTRLRAAAHDALQLQLGGAVGTRAALGEHGAQVARSMASALGLGCPLASWHTQRDDWVRLGLEVALLTASLGKIATDLALMAQGEVGELAEPAGAGRGGSSAMPHKRNPVAAMTALAASGRTPHVAAALLGSMGQQHERGLGNWQAELAEWPTLFLSAHGALAALADAFDGLEVNTTRMRANIDNLQGLVFAEGAAGLLAESMGRTRAHALLEDLSRQALAEGVQLASLVRAIEGADPARVDALFDPVDAAQPGARLARTLLAQLRQPHDEDAR